MKPEERVIIAMDLDDESEFKKVLGRISPLAKIVKIGPVALFGVGFQVIEMVRERGLEIFLDLKHMDIPNTVGLSAKGIAGMGVKMFTVHCLGGREMLREARRTLSIFNSPPLMIGVTLLTSWDEETLSSMGMPSSGVIFERLLKIGIEGGVDGFVCSPLEVSRIKEFAPGKICITPGIRISQGGDDQRRTGTPEEALKNGADYIVVGRPVIKAKEPDRAFAEIVERIERVCR